MTQNRIYLCLLLLCIWRGTAGAQRIVTNWNDNWNFFLGEISPENLTRGIYMGQSPEKWARIDLPHDFQIEQPWVVPQNGEKADTNNDAANVVSRLSARGFKEMGTGWYTKSLYADPRWKGRRILLDFEGIALVGDVYLNGKRVGGTDYGYVGFEVDLTDKLLYSQDNVIAVRSNTGEPQHSRWYTGGGLYRDVHLVNTPKQVFFARHPLYVTTSENKNVHLTMSVTNLTKANALTFRTEIISPQGSVVYVEKRTLPFLRKMKTNELKWPTITLDKPTLWNCETPALYKVRVSLLNEKGEVSDEVTTRFGVRMVEISPKFGLRLNGEKVLLKGIANHHTLGALGAAAYPKAMEQRLRLLKSFGVNHIRTSHNPYSTSFLDLCDELGILVVDELYDKWLTQYAGGRRPWMELWPYDLPEWIQRDRNHPSVVFWSLGNELQTFANLPFSDWGVTPYRMMKPVLLRYDNTRKITVAMHPRGRSLSTDSLPAPLVYETDIASYNYRYMYFDGDGHRNPNMVFYQSEANTSGMGPNFFGMNLDKVIGLAYWGQIDYLGESAGWPAKGWAQGAFDISLQPKPIAWLMKSMFLPEIPTVHIGIIENKKADMEWNNVNVGTEYLTENWNRKSGSEVSLYTFTNADEVELLLNGKSLGRQQNVQNVQYRNRIKWEHIPYSPGKLEAIAYKEGEKVARYSVETTGNAVKLILNNETDYRPWKADGQDLQYIRVYAVDEKGRRVLAANSLLHFIVEGDARIVAVDNGNIASNESFTGTERQLFGGSALVILRAGKTPSGVKLKVSGRGFHDVTLKLKTISDTGT